MSNSPWWDLNNNGIILELHDMCRITGCNRQKRIDFSPRQFHLKGSGFKSKMKEKNIGTEKIWVTFTSPGLKIASPNVSAAVAAKTKSPQAAQTTSNILKSISGRNILSLTDMHGNRLRWKVM